MQVSFQRPVNASFPDYSTADGIPFPREDNERFAFSDKGFRFYAPFDCVIFLNVRTYQANLNLDINGNGYSISNLGVGFYSFQLSKGDDFGLIIPLNYSNNIEWGYFNFTYFKIKGA